MNNNKEHSHIDALLAHASNGSLGEPVDMADVEATLHQLAIDPRGPHQLRKAIPTVNNPEIIEILDDWINQICDKLAASAAAAENSGEKIAAPIQTISTGAIATAILAGLIGTLATPVLIPGLFGATVIAGGATYARWTLARRKSSNDLRITQMRRIQDMIKG